MVVGSGIINSLPNEMAKILEFEEKARQCVTDRIISQIGSWYQVAGDNAAEFGELINRNPNEAVNKIPEFIQKAIHSCGPDSSYVNAVAGGFNPDFTAPLFDLVGQIYPDLPKNTRAKALRSILDSIGTQTYPVAQLSVETINEPWLVGDIVANEPFYRPGFKEYSDLLQQHQSWVQIYPRLDKIRSAFWMSLAVIYEGSTSPEVRDNYYRFFPTLIDRTQDALAAYTMVYAQNNFLTKGVPLEEGVEKRLRKYDPKLRPSIRTKIVEQKWVDLDDYIYVKDESSDRGDWKRRSTITDTYSPKPSLLTVVE